MGIGRTATRNRVATPKGVSLPGGASLRRIQIVRSRLVWIVSILLLLPMVGCQANSPGMGDRLAAHAAMIDFAGLAPAATFDEVAVRGEMPDGWDALPTQSNALFTLRQWRSPSRTVGVGVVHITLPLPISAKSVIWLAKSQYGDKLEKSGGHFIRQWTDALGREWFEAENDKYHVRGYAVTNGFDGWFVFTGFRRLGTPHIAEIGLAIRSMESIVPTPMTKQ